MQYWKSSAQRGIALGVLAAATFLTACSEPDVILPGKRENIRSVVQEDSAAEPAAVVENEARAISLPPVQSNANWTQALGTPASRVAHPALGSALQQVWSVGIGAGDGRRQRITADPVVAEGLVFTLDSESQVTATTVAGAVAWRTDLQPLRDDANAATGGGLAYKDGTLFVSLGYGSIAAVDAKTGGEIWRQRLDGVGVSTPTAFDKLVYVTSGDDTGWGLRASDGRIEWQLVASPDENNVLGGPAPAVAGDLAIFGFGSGELQAVFRQGGLRRWDASAFGERFGRALGAVGDVTGAPVISGNTVYVGNQSGRIVALNLESGARIWTAQEGAVGPVVPAGDSVFVVNELGELLRLDASDGSRIWGVQMPNFVKSRPRRRSEVIAHHGPILAGGRIYVASNDGALRGFDPANGDLLASVDIPGGATTAPVVAAGVLYVVSTSGKLHAFR
ncbi:PQQ-like beta-propeller repeat protein [Roseobacter sp. YSTF-M11]|uniref:PQQ-like beta-propeller repeat protein n=2 Tax=Roseobacter insulae TaxID=2859783 RepID=A0A9X1FTX2_9RHOB|nr:PQQ-like beta-propeller repeat protein [Roseobacter insulae]